MVTRRKFSPVSSCIISPCEHPIKVGVAVKSLSFPYTEWLTCLYFYSRRGSRQSSMFCPNVCACVQQMCPTITQHSPRTPERSGLQQFAASCARSSMMPISCPIGHTPGRPGSRRRQGSCRQPEPLARNREKHMILLHLTLSQHMRESCQEDLETATHVSGS